MALAADVRARAVQLPAMSEPARPARSVRDLGIGLGSAVVILVATFWASVDLVALAFVGLAIAASLWFSTVDRRKLVADGGRLRLWPFLALGVGVACNAATVMALPSSALFASLLLLLGAGVVGLVRALSIP